MRLKRRQFKREFMQQVVRVVEVGKPVAQAAREDEIHPAQITKWRQLHRRYAEQAFSSISWHDILHWFEPCGYQVAATRKSL